MPQARGPNLRMERGNFVDSNNSCTLARLVFICKLYHCTVNNKKKTMLSDRRGHKVNFVFLVTYEWSCIYFPSHVPHDIEAGLAKK